MKASMAQVITFFEEKKKLAKELAGFED